MRDTFPLFPDLLTSLSAMSGKLSSVFCPLSSEFLRPLINLPAHQLIRLTAHNDVKLHERSRLFFERMILPRKTVQLVIEAKRRGIDLDRILQEMLYPKAVEKQDQDIAVNAVR